MGGRTKGAHGRRQAGAAAGKDGGADSARAAAAHTGTAKGPTRRRRGSLPHRARPPRLEGGGIATTPADARPAWLGPRPTQADVEAAARMAHAHDFITALPDGYDTL